MPLDLPTIEALAPDQASLTAASKLTKASKWARLEYLESLYWGECQGSGANPYRVVVDGSDHGYKCTCPSRKFPCKHALALMWMIVTNATSFQSTTTPEWVNDWLSRRRRGSVAATAKPATNDHGKSFTAVEASEEPAKPDDSKAQSRLAAAREKRAQETLRALADATNELEQWVTDQLRLGLASLIDNASERCRRIAARMVDLKAAALASRIDEMPARLLALPNEERAEAVIRELGKLILLCQAWRKTPDEPEIRRQMTTSETREQIINDVTTLTVVGIWEVLGEKIQTRRDGLVSHATWLCQVTDNGVPAAASPQFAVLQDYYPASSGKRSESFYPGEQFAGQLAFYPSPLPLRALLVERAPVEVRLPWPVFPANSDPLSGGAPFWNTLPWGLEWPLLLPSGRVIRCHGERYWWLPENGRQALPLVGSVPTPLLGMPLTATAALWNGMRLDLLAGQTPFGRSSC